MYIYLKECQIFDEASKHKSSSTRQGWGVKKYCHLQTYPWAMVLTGKHDDLGQPKLAIDQNILAQ